ncbi:MULTISPECIES: hypothetical protein [Caproicibacterium]|uniref:Uncharacterized protein n=1 Tax=Caproicibacterium argilliputei TaxID=3030016 RepID=A0AA97H1Z7_9FIRM|nr:hypothetical protein [Caproicibacterium argilliputei]WOC32235.1 hypothetical protein PXC00_13765 [Caproicibacterium argilliputei]
MDSCLYVGAMLLFAACVLTAAFRPREEKGKFLCLLLAGMGVLTISLQQDGAFLLGFEILLGIVMTVCTTGVLFAEFCDRRAKEAAQAYERRRFAELRRRRAEISGTLEDENEAERRVA